MKHIACTATQREHDIADALVGLCVADLAALTLGLKERPPLKKSATVRCSIALDKDTSSTWQGSILDVARGLFAMSTRGGGKDDSIPPLEVPSIRSGAPRPGTRRGSERREEGASTRNRVAISLRTRYLVQGTKHSALRRRPKNFNGGDERKALFKKFCSSYRIFRHTTKDRVCLVWNDVDLEKMKAMMNSPETAAGKAKHTVIDPIEIYIEVDGGT